MPLPQARRCCRSFADLVDAVGHTPLVELKRLSPHPRVRLYAKLENRNPTGSVKDRVARALIADAEKGGALTPGQTIVEPSSGNTAISLAMICSRKGYRLKVVMPAAATEVRTRLLRMYGAEILYSPAEDGSRGAVAMAREMARNGAYYIPDHCRHDASARAHEETGAEILQELDELRAFVAGLGTGGTLIGAGRRLKECAAGIRIVAAEPLPGEIVPGLRTPEEPLIAPIADLSLLDRRAPVSCEQSIGSARKLLTDEGIFAGVSSGAAASVAVAVAAELGEGNIVFVVADNGWRYLSSGIYSKPFDELETTATLC